jgi:hypothetical protein
MLTDRLKRILIAFVLIITSFYSEGQITVSGSNGANGTYSTLTSGTGAFKAINNAGSQSGKNITITITANLSNENGPNGLNANNWTSLSIIPSGIRTISGNNSGPIINFNGADNVTIDGLNTSGNSLTITNTSSSNSANTTTIRFIADAGNNTITNCSILGSGNNVASGTIVFSNGTSNGNDNNEISNCIIGAAGSNLPNNAIYSKGSSTSIDNSGVLILNNIIKDCFAPSKPSYSIYLEANSSAWTISGNKFFQSATRTFTSGNVHKDIKILTSSGVGYVISSNIIGFANASSTGFTTYTGANGNSFIGIEISVGTSSVSNIQGNIISGISISTSSNAGIPGIFSGISVLSGAVNIGTTVGNTIGAESGNGSILITSSSSGGVITGIYATSVSTVSIKNNSIGAINTGGTAAVGYDFYGIYAAGSAGNFTIASNLIGSESSSNSIRVGISGVTTTGICSFTGIRTTNTGTKTILDNIIQNCSVYGTGNSSFLGINNSASSSILRIRNNAIIGGMNTGSSTTTAGLFTGIVNSGAVTSANISLNTLRNHIRTNSTALFTGISNTGTVSTTIALDSNQLGNASGELITYNQTNSRAFLGISNSGGSASSSLSIQYNNFGEIIHNTATSNIHTFIINSATTLSQRISYNTFTNLSLNTTGAVTFITNNVIMRANGTQNINYNQIVGSFTNSASSGSLTLFFSTASTTVNNVSVNHNNNDFSNITVSGSTSILGWVSTDLGTGSVTRYLRNNVFRNWNAGTGAITAINVNVNNSSNATNNNLISNLVGSSNIVGISTGLASTGNGSDNIYSNTIDSLILNGTTSSVIGIEVLANGLAKSIYQNTIYHLQANSLTSGVVAGIRISGGTVNSVYKNKIYKLFSNSSAISTGTINGILVFGSVASMITNLQNNVIGELYAQAASSTDVIRGVSILSTGATSSINVYYNTIYLNASSTGTVFGTSGIYHTASSTGTTATLDLRNNIIVNASIPNGSGITAVLRRSSNTFANYSTNSNNNLFYAGTPSGSNVILFNGTGYQTIANYKSIVGGGKDGASLTDDMVTLSKFVSTSGFSSDFLKIDSTKYCAAESAGANISGVTVDFEDKVRQGNSGYTGTGKAPDIGAFEFEGLWQWIGAVNTSWTNTGNWLTAVIPNAGASLSLNSGLPNYPIITSGTITLNSIFLATGSSFTLSNAELVLKGSIYNNGTLNVTNGTVELNGSAPQVIPSGAFYTDKVKNLTLNNSAGVTLNGNLKVTGILKAALGNFDASGYLTLVSDSNQTALVDGSGNGQIVGEITMQRFIDSAFGYKYLSSPFQAAKVAELNDDMDLSPSFPVLYKYDENQGGSGWISYTDTAQQLTPMMGYAANFGTNFSSKTIDMKGTVNNGSMQVSLYNHNQSLTQGFSLVGNPYPSPIDWNANSGWTKNNIDNALYFFDAGNADQYLGTYSTYINGVSSNGVADNIIGSMQGFFVHTSNGSYPVTSTLGFSNSVRINNLTEQLHKRDTVDDGPLVRLKCFYEEKANVADATVFYFNDSYSSMFDGNEDALKLMNTDMNIPNIYGLSDDNKKLSISGQALNLDSIKIMPLGIEANTNRRLIIFPKDIIKLSDELNIYLYDSEKSVLQNLRNQPSYKFVLKSRKDENRFSLVISRKDIDHLTGEQNTFKVYMKEGGLCFSLNPLISNASITISTMHGQTLYGSTIVSANEQLLPVNLTSGLYIISCLTNNGFFSKKIFIEMK